MVSDKLFLRTKALDEKKTSVSQTQGKRKSSLNNKTGYIWLSAYVRSWTYACYFVIVILRFLQYFIMNYSRPVSFLYQTKINHHIFLFVCFLSNTEWQTIFTIYTTICTTKCITMWTTVGMVLIKTDCGLMIEKRERGRKRSKQVNLELNSKGEGFWFVLLYILVRMTVFVV